MYNLLQGRMVLKASEALGLAHHFEVLLSTILALYHGVSEDDEIVSVSLYDVYMRLSASKRRVVNALLQALLEQQEEQENRQGSPTAARRNIEPGDRTYSCLDQCIEVAMGSIIPTTAVVEVTSVLRGSIYHTFG